MALGIRQVSAAIGGAEVLPFQKPASAAQYAFDRRLRIDRIGFGRMAVIIGGKPILAPFPEVAFHVVEAPKIGVLFANRVSAIVGIGTEPSVAGQVTDGNGFVIPAPAEEISALGAAAVLPLGFRRKPV